MGDIAHAAEDHRAYFALALAGLRGNTAHVRNPRDSVDHHHITRACQIVGFELRHLVHVLARGFIDMLALHDVAHGERRPDDARAVDGRLQHGCADNAGNTELVHHVRDYAAGVAECAIAFDDPFR